MPKDWLKTCATVDFETLAIRDRPTYPPAPVGVAIRLGSKSTYYAWGHPSGNSPDGFARARSALGQIYESGRPVLWHNGLGFDIEVAERHMGLPKLSWEQHHDTLPMLFLLDPHAKTYGLKPSAERYLNLPPDEQDAVKDWLVTNQPVPGVKISTSPKGKHPAGAYIAYAPAPLVGKYAIGDVDRTWELARLAYDQIKMRGMLEPYDRERRLSPVLRTMEQEGVRVDLERLESDVVTYGQAWERIEAWLRKKLKAEDLNFDSGKQLAEALLVAGAADRAKFGVTKTGQLATDRHTLEAAITDPKVYAALQYRGVLKKALTTYMRPWAETARTTKDGRIFTRWHSTRTAHHGSDVGAGTGRLSSTPNFQNIPNPFRIKALPLRLPEPPRVRGYIVPEEGHVFIDRDYSQQEPRILAHFEGGALMRAYRNDPWVDFHDRARELISEHLGQDLPRKKVKTVGLGLIYGMGVGRLAEQNGSTVQEAKALKGAYLSIFPGLKDLYAEMKRRARCNEPFRTWGGREYFCEPPVWVDGRLRQFDYKMPNALIQGSGADCTKEAAIRYAATAPKHHRLRLLIHDELVASVPKSEVAKGMQVLRKAMESVEFDVPILSEGAVGSSLDDLQSYDVKGKLCPPSRK